MTLNLNELIRGGTFCKDKAGLAEGTNDSTIKTSAPNGTGVGFAINGINYYKGSADNIDPTACAEQADDTTCLYLITVTTGNVIDTIKGTEVTTASLTAGTNVLVWPTPAVNTCPIGAIKIATDGATFTVGTDDLTDDISGGTVTYYDLFAVPAAPLTS